MAIFWRSSVGGKAENRSAKKMLKKVDPFPYIVFEVSDHPPRIPRIPRFWVAKGWCHFDPRKMGGVVSQEPSKKEMGGSREPDFLVGIIWTQKSTRLVWVEESNSDVRDVPFI